MGARLTGADMAKACIEAFLATPFGGDRHVRRVEKLTNPRITLSSYTQAAIAEIKKYYLDAKIIESSPIILADRSAKLVVYTGKDERSLLIKNLEVWTIDRGNAYIITYKAAPDRYYQFLETAMTMINSFELK